jgi:DUF1680 family protein
MLENLKRCLDNPLKEEQTPLGLQVNFHFDYQDERIHLSTSRDQAAQLDIQLKKPQPLFMRIPGWAPARSVQLWVNGQPVKPEWLGSFVFVSRLEAPAHIRLSYDLPVRQMDEETDGVNYHFTWRGDEIMSMTPNTDWLPFYPAGSA